MMAIEPAEVDAKQSHQTVFVDTFTNGLLGPEVAMLGPVADGGHIVWNSTPGCWGPMIKAVPAPLAFRRVWRSIGSAQFVSRFCEPACAGHRRRHAFGNLTDSFSPAT
jgi:hypothetical protein